VTVKLFYFAFDFILPLVVGYYLHRKCLLSEKACDRIIMINITVFCTVLSLLSIWVVPLQSGVLLWLPVFGIILSFVPALVAYLHKKYEDGPEKASYLASAMLSNTGTLGGLCTFFLFGEPGFAYIQIIALSQNLLFLLFCFPVAHYYQQLFQNNKAASKLSYTALFFNRKQLPVAGLAVGALLSATAVPRPEVLGDVFQVLIHVSAWTALIPAGYSIHFSTMRKYCGCCIKSLVPIKFVVTPLVAILLAYPLFSDPVIFGSILIAASGPTGINAIVLARLYNLDLDLAGAAFFLTTAVFLGAVYPILFLWLHV
jgi:predicted permease